MLEAGHEDRMVGPRLKAATSPSDGHLFDVFRKEGSTHGGFCEEGDQEGRGVPAPRRRGRWPRAPMQPVGSFGKQVSMGAVGGLGRRRHRFDEWVATVKSAVAGTMADSFPGGNLILAVTEPALHRVRTEPHGRQPEVGCRRMASRSGRGNDPREEEDDDRSPRSPSPTARRPHGEIVRAAKPDKVVCRTQPDLRGSGRGVLLGLAPGEDGPDRECREQRCRSTRHCD